MILLVASAGVLGGAERVLLDWAAALERRTVLACPPGPLAEAAAAAGLARAALRERPLQRSPHELGGLARELAGLVRRLRPAIIVASGQRAVLAAAPLAGTRRLALLHDIPTGAARAVQRLAIARAAAAVATSHAIARAVGGPITVIHPGVDPCAWI